MEGISLPQKLADYCILTMRPDELTAITDRLEACETFTGMSGRHYEISDITTMSGQRRVAVTRCEQGNPASGRASREIVEDLNPTFVFLCGIAGGIPSTDFGLGDVILGEQILDFTVSSANPDGSTTFSTLSGRSENSVDRLLEILPAYSLSDWNSSLALKMERPAVFGDPVDFNSEQIKAKWLPEVEKALGAMKPRTLPVCKFGLIGSSNTLVKDPEHVDGLLAANRKLCAVEMEAAGMMHALSEKHVPFLVVRGLSDVVGVKRLDSVWTPYACATAASYLLALLKSANVDRLVHPDESTGPAGQRPQERIDEMEITSAMFTDKCRGMHDTEIDRLINTFLSKDPWDHVPRSPRGAKIIAFFEWAHREGVLKEAYAWTPSRLQSP